MAAAGTASGADPLERKLTLAECIVLALENNRDLAVSRLGRLADRLSLEDAEDQFCPRPSISLSAEGNLDGSESERNNNSTLGFAPKVTMNIPTGTNARFELTPTHTATSDASVTQRTEIRLNQPLLKGAGTTFGTAGVVRARRRERTKVLSFRETVAGRMAGTIRAYRKIIQSIRAVEIAERSLQRARDQLAVNRVLIETGRMAQQDIVQTEASVAERELGLTVAEGALNDARLALIDILDIDSRTRIVPTEPLRVEPAEFDRDKSVETAFRNRTDYLTALTALNEGCSASRASSQEGEPWWTVAEFSSAWTYRRIAMPWRWRKAAAMARSGSMARSDRMTLRCAAWCASSNGRARGCASATRRGRRATGCSA